MLHKVCAFTVVDLKRAKLMWSINAGRPVAPTAEQKHQGKIFVKEKHNFHSWLVFNRIKLNTVLIRTSQIL